MSADSYLRVQDLSVSYGAIRAVDGVSFDVPQGTAVALLGANGAGKSSLMAALLGLVKHRGTVTLDGRDLTGMRPERRAKAGLSSVPEGRQVFSRLSVRENLLMGAGLGSRSAEARLDDVLQRFPSIAGRLNESASLLSGGEQQMVAVGRALITEPKVLLMDEPSLGLAPLLIEEIFRVIAELRDAGTTILLVEQNAGLALDVADFAYVLRTGRLVVGGTAAEVAARTDIEDAYLGGVE
ncbi:ABC transporter ATP-binding protein [Microbacterium sp. No. 7]|uniref:ABC transporter ATP-binding protein n=1 Tax=Microbacterium sp. No. 7 TaxID=1714373 RepID=UPI0006D24993|nr:ABC transporter ATP-binding protein [Microbacterium sp. No. 7]ALJ19247.1 branched-chain amino acid ABC transporter ATP-binding protein [Microbacterium sp. No. 7]